MSNQFKVGDVIKLKSGGPDMTIKKLDTTYDSNSKKYVWLKSYTCQWFAGKKLESGSFPHDSVEQV
ncbi:YodC family protein [Pantoea ananatis]|uniref:YodC family protein n=1 Tax=Pantoea ananas TaxID=553 RepID=UPI003FA42669